MNKEIQDYYEAYFDMFASKGWRQFIEDMENSFKNLHETALDEGNLRETFEDMRGQAKIMRRIIGFEALIELGFNQIKEESDSDSV